MDDKKRVIDSILYPVLFVVVIWIVRIIETVFHWSFVQRGLFPREASGLPGIVFSPFIHGDYNHLISNSFPLLMLGFALFYFYRVIAFRVFILSWLITGIWVWVMARPSYHIGASGLVYSLAAFLFVSGVIRRHPRLMAISLLVAFVYGGMVWGIFPFKERVSWESHLMGLVCGILMAFFFRSYGPQRAKYSWELEEETSDDEPDPATGQYLPVMQEKEFTAGNHPENDSDSLKKNAPSQTGNQDFRYEYRQKKPDHQ